MSEQTIDELRLIPGLDGYLVSKDGAIYSTRAPRKLLKDGLYKLSTFLCGDGGYPRVSTTINGIPMSIFSHKAAALAWIGPQPEGCEVCHRDGNPLNPHMDNLRWGTCKSNHADKVIHGTLPAGESHYKSKLTAEAVAEIRRAYANRQGRYWGSVALAKKYGVGPASLTKIVKGRNWKSVEVSDE